MFAEGPYGAFTTLHRTRDATLLIAGGVGITPIRALLEELTGPVVVLYRVRTVADAVLLAELQALAAPRGARLHLLTGRTGRGTPPNTPFAPDNLRALVPDIAERDVFVCGPPAMTAAVLRSLRELGVPAPADPRRAVRPRLTRLRVATPAPPRRASALTCGDTRVPHPGGPCRRPRARCLDSPTGIHRNITRPRCERHVSSSSTFAIFCPGARTRRSRTW